MEKTSHIIILPSPGMGHLIPLTEFAKRLVHHHNFSVTFTIPGVGPPSKAQQLVVNSLPNTITSILLPPVNLDDLDPNAKIEPRISLTVSRSLPYLRNVFADIMAEKRVVALVVDLFGTDAFDIANEFGVPPYIFYPTTAMCLSLFLYLPKLDAMYDCEYRDLPEPIRLNGCAPVHGRDLLDPAQDRNNDAYKVLLHQTKRYKLAEGILVNSFIDLEPGALKGLNEEGSDGPPVYPVGPLVRSSGDDDKDGSRCLEWLDQQPGGSVLFVSFGSGGTLSSEQLNELASGLEMSQQRFLWVVRSPSDKIANATYFSAQSIDNPFDFLPKGFLDRTKGVGLVVPSWAPQIPVLNHDSTGGFLTHCGWNSTLESIVHGVPLIAWPLFAEQNMNAVMLTDGLNIALRPKANENGVVGREEIARVVKGLMEGEEGKGIRNKMRDLKGAAARVLSEEGSSSKSISDVVNKWKNTNI
ncbi:hypothetical protein GIB67_006379 [Kingdonia uniflora]|uniref:Glycosyltransferase n=1 Tax=Kingdonia uniflora TaxID=39325 RepID=A0A7J7P113_9MAGN|nr:hypothetical protein GIB67_006379 [Kingdonia uniflora]